MIEESELMALNVLLMASCVRAEAENNCAKLRGDYTTTEADYILINAIETELKKRNVLKS